MTTARYLFNRSRAFRREERGTHGQGEEGLEVRGVRPGDDREGRREERELRPDLPPAGLAREAGEDHPRGVRAMAVKIRRLAEADIPAIEKIEKTITKSARTSSLGKNAREMSACLRSIGFDRTDLIPLEKRLS